MTNQISRITFLGDITCDRPLLEASRIRPGEYDFTKVFSAVRELLSESDYTVANLETVFGGSASDYKSEFFLLNCPDQMARAIRDAGITFVTTANNHCLDQGIDGLVRTINLLDAVGIAHAGTYVDQDSRSISDTIDVCGTKIAVLSYTSSTNESNTGIVLDRNTDYYVGLLKKQVDASKQSKGIKGVLSRTLSARQKRTIKRVVSRMKLRAGVSYFRPFVDQRSAEDTVDNPYLIRVGKEIAEAKQRADIVVVCPHMGGQFNTVPGEYSEFLIQYLRDCGADVIVGNHPHVVQRVDFIDDCVAAYSIGGFNLSTSADYIVHESLPEYSIALHVYIDNESHKIVRSTFSILKNVEMEDHSLTVYPIHLLPDGLATSATVKEVTAVYNRITGQNKDRIEISAEYLIYSAL